MDLTCTDYIKSSTSACIKKLEEQLRGKDTHWYLSYINRLSLEILGILKQDLTIYSWTSPWRFQIKVKLCSINICLKRMLHISYHTRGSQFLLFSSSNSFNPKWVLKVVVYLDILLIKKSTLSLLHIRGLLRMCTIIMWLLETYFSTITWWDSIKSIKPLVNQ